MKHDQVSERGVTSAHRMMEEEEEEEEEKEKKENEDEKRGRRGREGESISPFSYASLI